MKLNGNVLCCDASGVLGYISHYIMIHCIAKTLPRSASYNTCVSALFWLQSVHQSAVKYMWSSTRQNSQCRGRNVLQTQVLLYKQELTVVAGPSWTYLLTLIGI